MKHNKESIQRLIHETVSLLCRNSFSHDVAVRIQGLIGITVDSEVLLVHFDESYGSEHGEEESSDIMSPTGAAVADLPTYKPRKHRSLEETTATADTSCNTADAEHQPATGDVDCDVIFVADDANDNDVKREFDEFYSSVDSECSYDEIGNSLVFKAHDTFSTTNLNTDINNGENQSGYVGLSSRGNVLLRNVLADQSERMITCPNSYLSAQSLGQSVLCEGTTVQTSCVKHEQTATTRLHINQVLIMCIAKLTGLAKR